MRFFATMMTFVCFAATTPIALANNSAPKVLKCSFTESRAASWDNGELSVRSDADNLEITFVTNYESGSAKMIGNAGSSDVIAASTGTQLVFVEQTRAGNVTMTSVFYHNGLTNIPAVHSRHMVLDAPVASQLYGTCKRLE